MSLVGKFYQNTKTEEQVKVLHLCKNYPGAQDMVVYDSLESLNSWVMPVVTFKEVFEEVSDHPR